MRMWGINPNFLCDKHLLGEHVEMHMFAGVIRKGTSIKGYIERGLVNPARIKERHDELAKEMIRRGMNHQSPLPYLPDMPNLPINTVQSKKELARRCQNCRRRIYNEITRFD